MTRKTQETIMSAKERYLVEDSIVETLDAQRQPEALSNIKIDDGKAGTTNGQDDVSGVNEANKPDDFMESVKAFIRGIDINSL